MSLKIKFNDYEFPIMPTFAPNMSIEYDGQNNPSVITEVWDLETAFVDVGANSLMQKFNEMEAAVRGRHGKIELLKGSLPLRVREPADCISGPRVTNYEISEPREAALCTNLQIRVSVEMTYPVVSGTPWLELERNMTYSVNEEGLLSVSESSRYRTNPLVGSITPSFIPLGFSPPAGTNFTDNVSYSYSDNNEVVSITASWEQIRCNYPFDWVSSGNYSISERFEQGLVEVSCSGSFVVKHSMRGKADIASPRPEQSARIGAVSQGINDVATDYAQRLLDWVSTNFSADTIVDHSVTYDPYSGGLSFNLKWYRSISGHANISIFRQSFSVNENFQQRNIVQTLDGLPVIQKAGWTGYSVTHTGTVTGINSMPDKPEPEWPENLMGQPSYNYAEPQVTMSGEYVMYSISFIHNYWFADLEEMGGDVSAAFEAAKNKYMPGIQRRGR